MKLIFALVIFFTVNDFAYAQDSIPTNWEQGRIPEGSNAFTLKKREFRLNPFGKSAYGINNKLELNSYLTLIIFPNIGIKYRFLERKTFFMAYQLGLGAGVLPVAGAGALPLPGAVIGVVGGGLVFGSIQYGAILTTWHPSKLFTLSLRSGVFEAEGAFVGVGGFLGVGGGGAIGGAIPLGYKKSRTGYILGIETDFSINKKNAIIFKCSYDALFKAKKIGAYENAYEQNNYSYAPGTIITKIGWTHALKTFRYTVGMYHIIDPRNKDWTSNKNAFIPGLLLSCYWDFLNKRKPKK